jgi:FkbM family methyltransferase
MSFLKIKVLKFIRTIRPALLGSFIKKFLFIKREKIETSRGIFWIDPGSDLGFQLLEKRTYEPKMATTLKKYLKPGDIFVDLGANEGYFSVVASKLVGHRGRVIAIEPQTRLQNVIAKNIELNNSKNITIIPAIVSDRMDKRNLYLTSSLNTGASSLYCPTKYPLPKEKVKTVTLNQVSQKYNINKCNLIKIDIEGGEYEAILGSIDLFRDKKVEAIALELHPKILSKRQLSADRIIQILEEFGYTTDRSLENLVLALKNVQKT